MNARQRHEDKGGTDAVFSVQDYLNGTAPVRPASPDMTYVASRLLKKFGSGDNPKVRRELFNRLEREVAIHGARAYAIIRSCVNSSESAVHPDRYFCSSVARRLREAGLFQDSSGSGGF